MDKFFAALLIGIGAVALIGLLAVLGGTFVFWLWPVAIPAAFPGLVTSGAIAAKLTWGQAVCLTWIFGILIKSTQSNSNNCNKD